MSILSDALFTVTQQKVLGLLYSTPDKSYYLKEIIRQTGMGVATIKRELDRMLTAEIITLEIIGNQHHYQANSACPIFEELLGIVKKTIGVADIIKEGLNPISPNILWSFIFGSVASNKENTGSDIDLMVIGHVSFADVIKNIYPAQEQLSREINPKIYQPDEWKHLIDSEDGFIKEVMAKPKINLIGTGDELR